MHMNWGIDRVKLIGHHQISLSSPLLGRIGGVAREVAVTDHVDNGDDVLVHGPIAVDEWDLRPDFGVDGSGASELVCAAEVGCLAQGEQVDSGDSLDDLDHVARLARRGRAHRYFVLVVAFGGTGERAQWHSTT